MCFNDGRKTTCMNFSSILSHETLQVSKSIELVEQLLQNSKDVGTVQDSEIESLPSFHAGAFVLMPRDWVHVSYVNLDSRQLDLYLMVHSKEGLVGAPRTGSYVANSYLAINMDDDLTFSIRYNRTLFAPEHIEGMMRSWESLLDNFQVSVP